jgi:hypothetical protein
VIESKKRQPSFLDRLFARYPEAAWNARWADPPLVVWDGGASTDEESERLDQTEMTRVAASCDKTTLRKILKFGSDNAVIEALNNPSLEREELINLCSRAKTGPNVLAAIARRRELSGDPGVAREVCLNPKAPYYASRSLLGILQVSDLREIAKSPLAPPQLVKDARNAIENKTK